MRGVPFLWRIVVSAIALWAVTLAYPDGLHLEGAAGGLDAVIDFLLAGLVLVVANAVLRPLLLLLTLPLNLMTLGLFTLVVNALVLAAVAALTRLELGPVGPAIIAALLVSLVSWLVARFFRSEVRR